MPTNIKLTVSVNGGAPQQGPVDGGIAIANEDVIQLSHANTSGAKTYRFEISEYGTGFTLPAGWSLDGDGRTYYFAGPNPPAFTIPNDDGIWGNWILRLIIDDGKRPSTTRPGELEVATDLIDATVALVKPGALLKDTAFTETNQVDQLRYAVAAMKYNWRVLDELALAAGGEANIASNVGTGVGVYDSKDGVQFLFRSILAGTGISVELVDGGAGLHDIRVSLTGSGGGGGCGIPYTFDTGTGASNPGDGELRFNHGTYLSAASMYINDEDANGADMTGFIPTWDDSTSAIKGILIITAGSTAIMVAAVTSVTANSGYYTVGITPLAADGTFPTDPGALCVLFCPKGDKGDAGDPGDPGDAGDDGDDGEPGGESFRLTLNDGSNDPDADPGDGLVVFDNANQTLAENIAVDLQDVLERNITNWLDSLDDAASATKGRLRAYSRANPALFAEYRLTSVTPASGYRKLGVTYLFGPGGIGTTAGDLVLSFARPGDGSDGLPGGESFFWQNTQTTTETAPADGYSAFNAALVKDATAMFVNPANFDGSNMADWLDSWAGGYTLTITYLDDPLKFVLFEIDSISKPGDYYKIGFRRTIDGGNFQFAEDAKILVSLSRSGSGTGGSSGSAAGIASVIDAWKRVQEFGSEGPANPPHTERLAVWVPGYNQWIRLTFSSYTEAGEVAGIGQGSLNTQVMARAEGGLTGAIHDKDFPGGWDNQGYLGAGLAGPVCACVAPINTPSGKNVYVFAGCSKSASGGASADNKLWRSTDGGITWSTFSLNRSDTAGPGVLLWTGTRLVAAYNASGGEVETSDITAPGVLGETWVNRSVPGSTARRWGATDGNGTVVLLGDSETYIYSTDEGITWSLGTMPSFDEASPVGLVFCNGRFYVLLDSNHVVVSSDGVAWEITTCSFSHPDIADAQPIEDRCFRAHGDLLVAMFKSGSSPSVTGESDLFYCDTTAYTSGNHWVRSGVFGGRYIYDLPYRPRIHLATSAPESPAQTNTDRLQLLFFPDQTGYNISGGQYAECWMSPADVRHRAVTGSGTTGSGSSSSTSSTAALIRQRFSSVTTMAAPSEATFRLSSVTPGLVTGIAFDHLTVDNINVETFLNPDSPLLATVHNADFSVWHQFNVTDKANNANWTQWTVEYVDGEGDFIDGTEYSIEYDATGSGGSSVTAATNAPEPVAASASLGAVTTRFAREDHAHAHDDQAGGSLHAVVGAAAGFMPGTSGASEGDVPVVQNDGSIAYEANSVPEVSSSGAGLMPSTSGVSDGWIPVVQGDGSIDYESAGAPTDHGGLTGLGDDDHAIYLLASGARALAGTWSLGGNPLTNVGNLTATGTPTWNLNGGDLTNVDDITMAGSDSVIVMNGGDISGLDDLTFAGSGSKIVDLAQLAFVVDGGFMGNLADLWFNGSGSMIQFIESIWMDSGGDAEIDMNGGSISDVAALSLTDSSSVIDMTDGSMVEVGHIDFTGAGSFIDFLGEIRLRNETSDFPAASGSESVIRGAGSAIGGIDVRGEEWASVLAGYQKNASAENNDTIGQAINMADIKGINFANGVARMRVVLVSVSNTEGAGYGQQFEEAWYVISTRTGTTCVVQYLMQQPEIWSPSADQDASYFRIGGMETTERITVNETGQYTFTVTGTVRGSTSTTWTSRLMIWIEGVCL